MVDNNNNAARGLEAEAELAGGMKVEVSDTSDVRREYNKQVISFTRWFYAVSPAETSFLLVFANSGRSSDLCSGLRFSNSPHTRIFIQQHD